MFLSTVTKRTRSTKGAAKKTKGAAKKKEEPMSSDDDDDAMTLFDDRMCTLVVT